MALRTLLARSGIQLKWNPALATTSLAQNGLQRFFATVQDDRKYAESHEWAQVDGDNATVGISDFAQVCATDLMVPELGWSHACATIIAFMPRGPHLRCSRLLDVCLDGHLVLTPLVVHYALDCRP